MRITVSLPPPEAVSDCVHLGRLLWRSTGQDASDPGVVADSPRTLWPPSTLKTKLCEGVADIKASSSSSGDQEYGTMPRSKSATKSIASETQNASSSHQKLPGNGGKKKRLVVRQYKSLDCNNINPANV